VKCQMQLLEGDVSEGVDVSDQIVNAVSINVKQPELNKDQETGVVHVTTKTHLTHDVDVLDFNHHLSASTMKMKMKSADAIYSAMGLPLPGHIVSCAELNKMSMNLAMSVAGQKALNRLKQRGRKLEFVEDLELEWGGIPWEVKGLTWTEDSNTTVKLQSSRLTSDVDFPLFPGMQYCDVLSPYRALEWIYIESLRHTMQF